ncbi:copper chaperone PCu(A)C [Rarobacter incanus]|uniref:Copper(I)-binding protein n=1 Tax=Rarobacter incanus TaxID=153494 RepID=A0A542SQN7_9MICO|nr:copper chaperone PCu(A)C [Rarobacter incanus]TQK76908.1 hypothetical protein FB389_1610 [Rarobacter incanus]
MFTSKTPVRTAAAMILGALTFAALAGCTTSSEPTSATSLAGQSQAATLAPAQTQADAITASDVWAKAADKGAMTAMFAVLTNNGTAAATITAAESEDSSSMQLHETVTDASGATAMQKKDGGFTIGAGETLELTPGGNHIMYMALARALKAGDDASVTLSFADGSTLTITGPIREYSGAQETYTPDHAGADMGGGQ